MHRRQLVPLLALFGTLYFVQGIVEPTACLPMQPLQTQLRAWSFTPTQTGQFFGIIGIAWSLKPVFGLISDFFPLAGYRRWPYLVLSTAAAGAAFLLLAAMWGSQQALGEGWLPDTFGWLVASEPGQPDISQIGWLLVVAGIGIAMTDVVIDALAVETGQPLGMTGRIQAVQWFALSVAGLLAGTLGGYVVQNRLQKQMFVACGLLALASLLVVLLVVRDPRHAARPRDNLRLAWKQIMSGRRIAVLLSAAVFLFLWNFNPFSANVQQDYMTKELGFPEQFYGHLISVQAVGMIVGALAYGWYCRRVPFGLLVHGSIVAGIASTLAYWLLRDKTTAVFARLVFGLAWQTGVLVQLDLSARICPTESAGTMFALLMAISNSGESVGIYLGGAWYDALAGWLHSRELAFHTLVGIGAAFTACCWLVVPVMKWAGVEWK